MLIFSRFIFASSEAAILAGADFSRSLGEPPNSESKATSLLWWLAS